MKREIVEDKWIPLDSGESISLHIRQWTGENPSAGPTWVLLHGLASNARTWDAVAGELSAVGHRVIAVDQRGHGLSDKPDDGYDFTTVTADLAALLDALTIDRAIVVGQSWGGNVALAFGAAYPDRVEALGLVDGGTIDLQMRPGNTWEATARDLKPPVLLGTPAATMAARMRRSHPDWSDEGIAATMANFEILADGTVRPWLSLDRHMLILRALWEQRPGMLYSQIQAPVYIAAAEDGGSPAWTEVKARQVASAEAALSQVWVDRFPATDHDIHVHRPHALASALLTYLGDDRA